MAKYRVKPGRTFGAFNQFLAGSVVEMTEEEAKGFLDKLTPLSKAKQAPVAPPPLPPLKNDHNLVVPDEFKLLKDSEEGAEFDFDDEGEEIVEEAGVSDETDKPKRTPKKKNK